MNMLLKSKPKRRVAVWIMMLLPQHKWGKQPSQAKLPQYFTIRIRSTALRGRWCYLTCMCVCVQWLWIQCTAQLFTSSHNKKHNDFMQKIQTIYLNQNKNTKHTNKVSKHIHHLNKCDRASSCSSLHKTAVMGTTHVVMRTACSKRCGNGDKDTLYRAVMVWSTWPHVIL